MIAEVDGIFCARAIRFRRESYRSRYASSQKTPSLLHVRILRVFPIRIAQTWRDFVYLRQNGSKLPHIFEVGTSNRRVISFFSLTVRILSSQLLNRETIVFEKMGVFLEKVSRVSDGFVFS